MANVYAANAECAKLRAKLEKAEAAVRHLRLEAIEAAKLIECGMPYTAAVGLRDAAAGYDDVFGAVEPLSWDPDVAMRQEVNR